MTRITHCPLLFAAAALGVAVLCSSSDARAQAADLNPVAPNVMLAVDSSGSMEYTATPASDCTSPPCLPKCYPAETTAANHETSRWIDLVEVLTGTIRDYTCWAQDRSTADFADEYRLGTVEAVDANNGYSLPYHRPQSNLCTPGPGTLPASSAPHEFPAGYRADHDYSIAGNALTTISTCSSWRQLNDGLLDTLNQQIRFGLMTFDTHPDPGTGVSAGIADYGTGTDGTWSYFLDAKNCPVVLGGGADPMTSYCQGNPEGCTTGPFPMEVGARNQYAPPAEGRMVAFGSKDASGTELAQRNAWIQDVLLMTRPYGATPIAGLMSDAREFFWHDETTDPLTGKDFGPFSDEQVEDGCRRNFLVVLSDGEPNLDMRGECAGSVCPYQEPWEIADDLVDGGGGTNAEVRTYSIGFAVSEVDLAGTLTACEELLDHVDDPCNDSAYDGYRELQACCTLNEIAYYGTPLAERTTTGVINHALFADNPAELRAALARVFNEALSAVTARTLPVFSGASSPSSNARAVEFKAAVDVRSADLWRGKLERTRFVCQNDGSLDVPDPDETAGDDFIANVNSDPSSRKFYTFVPDDETRTEFTQRPYLASGAVDGVGTEGTGTESKDNDPSTFAPVLNEDMMGVSDSLCDTASEDLTAAECAERISEWLLGLDNGTGYHRCETPGSADCNVVADILHATPQIRGVPNEFLRDESYAVFAGNLAQRDTVLYTSSNDGFFHAFLVTPGDPTAPGVTTKANNELWAFVPPAIMEGMPSQYPGTHQLLLDGKPVIKDVVATGSSFPYKLERTRADAIGQGGGWRTILVQSFGAQRSGYYALDITKPTPDSADAESGPRFLWQLTTDESGDDIFGTNGTPLITTVFMDTGASTDPIREVAVAVLPGGNGGSPDGLVNCTSESAVAQLDANFTPATLVDCYDQPEARSLTIVRLDSGEILKTFRANGVTEPVTFDSSVLTNIDIPAPIVGEPAAFPAQTGGTADRIFVGDREGRLWRIDVTNTDPADWDMQLFFDAYAHPVGTTARQPILTPPVMSVDDAGQITINFSTGDQDTLTYTDPLENYVYSLTEVIDATTGELQAQLNWRFLMQYGAVVTGPLTLFDRRLFFSVFYPQATTDACTEPTSDVFGMNYIVPFLNSGGTQDETPPYTKGGKAEYPKGAASPGEFVQSYSQADGNSLIEGIVFGVGLRQTPSCAVDSTSPNTDDFLGYGTTTSTTTSNPGAFQLVFQKGGGSQGSDAIQSEVVDLAPPRTPVSIDTWAPILE